MPDPITDERERILLRLSAAERDRLLRAAGLQGLGVADFIVEAA